MKNIKKMLIVLLLGTMISAIEMTTRMGLFIIFALGVATIVSSLVLFSLFMILPLLSTAGIWLGMIAALLILLFSHDSSSFSVVTTIFQRKDQQEYIFVNSREEEIDSEKIKRFDWIGSQIIGNEPYEWNDINAGQLVGDTIIDLGNTILPAKENVIVIRKGLGRVRILVPYGVGVMIHHHSFAGELEFEKQSYTLSNESIQLYSKDYQRTSKRVKIYTTIVAGKIEVIEA